MLMNRIKKLISETGMTLIELLIALALISIITSGLISVYWCSASAFNREGLQADAQYDARLSLGKIITDVGECTDMAVTDKSGSILPLNTEPTNEQKPVQLHLGGVGVVYKTDGDGRLQRQQSGDTKTLTVNKTDTVFINRGNGTIEISIKILDEENKPVYKIIRFCRKRVD